MNHFPAIRDDKPIQHIDYFLICKLLKKVHNGDVLTKDNKLYRQHRALKNLLKHLRRVMTELYDAGELLRHE